MKRMFVAAAMAAIVGAFVADASAQQRVDGYTRRDGTYVQPHYRSTPDNSYNNNWSVQGNQNPYTGNYGTRSPTYNDRAPQYNQQQYGSPMYSNPYGNNDRRRY